MSSAQATTVDEYLLGLPPEQRAALQELRETIRDAAPDAREVISYRIPLYKYKGDLVAFGGFKGHCSFFVMDSELARRFGHDLPGCEVKHTTIHFPPDQPLPAELVRAIVEARIERNEKR